MKDTRHVVFNLHGSGLTYKAGDALGVLPENCHDAVGWLLEALDATGAEQVTAPDGTSVSFHEALVRSVEITQPSGGLVRLLADAASDPQHARQLASMLADDGPGIPEGHEILDLLMRPVELQPTARSSRHLARRRR